MDRCSIMVVVNAFLVYIQSNSLNFFQFLSHFSEAELE